MAGTRENTDDPFAGVGAGAASRILQDGETGRSTGPDPFAGSKPSGAEKIVERDAFSTSAGPTKGRDPFQGASADKAAGADLEIGGASNLSRSRIAEMMQSVDRAIGEDRAPRGRGREADAMER